MVVSRLSKSVHFLPSSQLSQEAVKAVWTVTYIYPEQVRSYHLPCSWRMSLVQISCWREVCRYFSEPISGSYCGFEATENILHWLQRNCSTKGEFWEIFGFLCLLRLYIKSCKTFVTKHLSDIWKGTFMSRSYFGLIIHFHRPWTLIPAFLQFLQVYSMSMLAHWNILNVTSVRWLHYSPDPLCDPIFLYD